MSNAHISPLFAELLDTYMSGQQFTEARAVAASLRELAEQCADRALATSYDDEEWMTALRDGLRHGASVIDQLIAEKK